jgi:hypothetical protein
MSTSTTPQVDRWHPSGMFAVFLTMRDIADRRGDAWVLRW